MGGYEEAVNENVGAEGSSSLARRSIQSFIMWGGSLPLITRRWTKANGTDSGMMLTANEKLI